MAKKIRNVVVKEDSFEENAIERAKRIVPANCLDHIRLKEKQRELLDVFDNNQIIIVNGPAGTAKTFLGCYYAIKSLKENKFKKIILTKPIQESGEKLGALPGDVEQKINPFYESFKINFGKIVGKAVLDKLYEKNYIEDRPLSYMRGATFDSAILWIDEAQNANIRQLMLFLTRMGQDSKVIISGDVRQYDISKNDVALPFFAEEVLKDIKGIAHFVFTDDDIVRNKILIEVTKRYEELKHDGKIPKNLA